MVWKRVVSGLVAVPIVLAIILYGDWPLLFLVMALSLLGWHEFKSMLRAQGLPLYPNLGLFLLLLLQLIAWWRPEYLPFALTITLLTVLAGQLWRFSSQSFAAAAYTLLTVLYMALPISHLYFLHQLEGGWRFVLLALFGTWAYDICAFFVGCGIGKRRPWPAISPNKSLEGAIGGLLGSIIISLLFLRWLGIDLWLVHGLLLGVGIGFLAQTGDLAESALKRNLQTKDSGVFLPGHGGLLDRIDSLLFTIPFVYYYLVLLVI